MRRTLWLVLSLALVAAMLLGACAPAAGPQASGQKLKVAFIYIGPPGDLGWTYEHDRGRKMLEEKLGSKVETKSSRVCPKAPTPPA